MEFNAFFEFGHYKLDGYVKKIAYVYYNVYIISHTY
jgi:hypothetical protein